MEEMEMPVTNGSNIPLLCRSDLQYFPYGAGKTLALSRHSQNAAVLSHSQLSLLNHCNIPRSLDEHVENIISIAGSANRMAEEAVHSLARDTLPGFMYTAFDYLLQLRRGKLQQDSHRKARESIKNDLTLLQSMGVLTHFDLSCHREDQRSTGCSISTLGIVTRNRPADLKNCLTSYLSKVVAESHVESIVIMDNSEDPKVRERNRTTVFDLQKNATAQLLYAGAEEKARYSDMLVAWGDFEPGIINFALFDTMNCGRAIGANRNALLLETIGNNILSVDDDTTCDGFRAPGYENITSLFSGDPTEFWFFPDKQAVTSVGEDPSINIILEHEKLLGNSIGDCLIDFGWRIDETSGVPSVDFLHNVQNRLGKIAITQAGLAGDCAMWSPHGYLTLKGASFDRLTQSEADYKMACVSRHIIRAPRSYSISEAAHCMAYNIGIDNRELLPPFFPVLRNQDGLFASMLKKCINRTYLAYLPVTVFHFPPEIRRFGPNDIWENSAYLRMCDVIYACLDLCPFFVGFDSPEGRMRSLGKRLIELGSLDLPEFESTVYGTILKSRLLKLAGLEKQLHSDNGSANSWKTDLVQQIETLKKNITKKRHLYSIDLCREDETSLCRVRELTQRLVLTFGKLLSEWPDIVEASRQLRQKEVSIARVLKA